MYSSVGTIATFTSASPSPSLSPPKLKITNASPSPNATSPSPPKLKITIPSLKFRKFNRKVKFRSQLKLFQYGQALLEIPQEDVCATFLQALHSLLARPFTHRKKLH